MQSVTITSPLTEFLNQANIEASPAWEFIQGQADQKPLPSLFHSRLQRNFVNFINGLTSDYEAIQEWRCIVPPFSPVPDISVVAGDRFPIEDEPLTCPPDWMIEMRSPDQNMLDLQNQILHCLGNGTKLAWLIDMQRRRIWVWQGRELPVIYAGTELVPMVEHLGVITVDEVIAMATQR
jgi:Uma2 family endonuclease